MLVRCLENGHCLASGLILSLAILHAVAANSNNYICVAGLDSPGATVPKGDIVLEEGSSLEIFCNLNISHKEAQGRNASNLAFYRNDKKVSPEFVEVINATTIRLFKERPPASTDMYYCKLELPNNVIGICLNMVAIGFKPQEVKDFNCISHNWQNLTCRWIKPENPVKTSYKLHFYLPGRAGKRLLFNCPEKKSSILKRNLQKNEEMCFWDLYTDPHYRQPYEYYYFEIKGSNPLGEIKFDPIKFHHYSHVIPSPPEKLIVVNTTTNSAFLTWDVPFPMQIFPPGVHHQMVYQSTYDNSERWHVANTSYLPDHGANQTYNLTNLIYANTLYDVRVYLRSAFAVGDDKWSHHASVTFKTEATVPGAPPETVIGSFEVISEGFFRDVYVYWRQVPLYLHNGDKFEYKVISVKENGIEKHLIYDHTLAYARFKNLTYNAYEFSIVSTNIVGDSVTKSIVQVPSKKDMPKEPVSFTKIAFHEGIYELSWKAPSESPNIDSYTIFWCLNGRDRPYQCTGILNWTVVPSNVTLKNITVPDDTKIYQFAISANTKNASSGMVWASCTVIHNKVVDKMKSVWINRIGSSFIEVGWKLECSDRIGRVEAFQIGFCPIVSPRETTCKEPPQSIKLEPSERQFHGNVTGLRPYTTYMVNIAIVTNNGKSTPSDPLFNTTMEAAPDPPTNVTVTDITNSSMSIHWSPPDSMNGVLRFYEVIYNQSKRKVESRNFTMYVLDNLASFTTYSISVVACTVDCSEPSVPVKVRTKIGNPGKLERPQARSLNNSQVLVSWGYPKDEKRGGRLDYYEVCVQQSDGAKNASKPHIFTSPENVSQIPIPECSKDESRVKYTFWVRAVNKGEKNETFYGPWSEPGETNCYSSGPTLAVKITIYVICFLLVTALFIAVACVGRRIWNRCKEMREVEVKLPPGLAPIGGKEKDTDFHVDVTWNSGDHDHHLTGMVRPSADEEHLLKKKKEKKEERHGRNPSGDSSGCSSGHESVSSSLTSGTQISSDSGTEVDQRPPSPDGVFEESTPWDRASLRLRKASSSVARSTPNLSDVEGLSSGHCVGAWSSTGYISMPSSEELGTGTGEGTSYCRVGLDGSPIGTGEVPPVQQMQLPPSTLGKGYVVLPSTPPNAASTSLLSSQLQHSSAASAPILNPGPQSVAHGYVSHQLTWASQKESPNKGYVMAGELGEMASKTSPSSHMMMRMRMDEDQSILDVDSLETDAQTPESYCRLGLCSLQPIDGTSDGEASKMNPSAGYVTLGEGSHSADMVNVQKESTNAQGASVAGISGYVPHRHFEKRNALPLSSAFNEQVDVSCTKMIPPSSGEMSKTPATNL